MLYVALCGARCLLWFVRNWLFAVCGLMTVVHDLLSLLVGSCLSSVAARLLCVSCWCVLGVACCSLCVVACLLFVVRGCLLLCVACCPLFVAVRCLFVAYCSLCYVR